MSTLIAMARAAGLAGAHWGSWTASDEVQALIETAETLDTLALEAAFAEGQREHRLATWRAVWTTAPADYDTMGTETVAEDGEWYGKALRRVVIEPRHFVYQTSRYASGLHPSWEESPRVEEARANERSDRERAEREAHEAKRAAGLEWLKTATADELEDFDAFEPRGLQFSDARAERVRREKEEAESERVGVWARCTAIVVEGVTLIDDGSPGERGVYGWIRGRDSHVYYGVTIIHGWPDDADHANVMGEGGDNAGSLAYVADWIASGRLHVAKADEVPPRAVVARIGHDRLREIKRVEVEGRTVWVGRATFGETIVLDEKGRLVRAKKVLAAVG